MGNCEDVTYFLVSKLCQQTYSFAPKYIYLKGSLTDFILTCFHESAPNGLGFSKRQQY